MYVMGLGSGLRDYDKGSCSMAMGNGHKSEGSQASFQSSMVVGCRPGCFLVVPMLSRAWSICKVTSSSIQSHSRSFYTKGIMTMPLRETMSKVDGWSVQVHLELRVHSCGVSLEDLQGARASSCNLLTKQNASVGPLSDVGSNQLPWLRSRSRVRHTLLHDLELAIHSLRNSRLAHPQPRPSQYVDRPKHPG